MGIFQLILFIAMLLYTNIIDPLIFGTGFLTRDPNSFECLDPASDMWKPCTRAEICSQGLDHDHYHPVPDDETIDNWTTQEKFDTLCEPKYKIGLLNSIFFAGVVSSVLVIPILADKYGRKPVVITAVCLQIIG